MNITTKLSNLKELEEVIYPLIEETDKNRFETLLFRLYIENCSVRIFYRHRGKIYQCMGKIERIDFIYKEVFLKPKKKLSFEKIIAIKQ